MAETTCSITGCDDPVSCRGWCKKHYTRWWRHGDPNWAARNHGTFPANLLAQTAPQPDGCVLFTGNLNRTGYGILSRGDRTVLAHRAAYEHFVGPIPDGHQIDHLCHNESGCVAGPACLHRRCVNTDHLRPATPRENTNAATGANIRKTHCKQGHPYDGDNLFIGSKGERCCRSCANERQRRYLQRKRLTP